MKRLKNIASISTLLTLYYSFFYPHIDYGLMLWGGASKTALNKIFVIQKKAIRTIANTHYNAHTTPLFAILKVLKLEDIYEMQLAKFIFGLYKNNMPKPLQSFFSTNSEIHHYGTRNRCNPIIRLHKSNVAARSIFSQSYKLWYNMESDVKGLTSLFAFSKRYKKTILQKYLAM